MTRDSNGKNESRQRSGPFTDYDIQQNIDHKRVIY